MFATVSVLFALSFSSSWVTGQQDCLCYPYHGNYEDIICADPSLTSFPDCVPSNTPILTVETPSIPLVPETLERFTNLIQFSIVGFKGPIVNENLLLYQRNLKSFNLWETDVDYIDNRWFVYAPGIERVRFSNNMLSSLPEDTFSSLPNLSYVELSSNLLTTLPANLFEGTSIAELYLDNNPWHCECELMKTIRWLKDRGVPLGTNANCWQPVYLRGLNLLDLTEEVACAPQPLRKH